MIKQQPKIYVFMGYSGAGKDTAAAALVGVENIKFASPGKRALEFMYRLAPGFLDDRVKRQQIAPHSGGQTYLEVLIQFWKHRDKVIGSELFGQQTKADIVATLERGVDVAITDMRSANELDVLYCLYTKGYEVSAMWIGGGNKLESDNHQLTLALDLNVLTGRHMKFMINDAPSAEAFQNKVLKALASI